jgi:hypothetical protein
MLHLIFFFLLLHTPDEHPLIKDCKITKDFGFMKQTWSLYGNVKVVTEHADFDVKIVPTPGLAAMYVKKMSSTPTQCGEWRFVDSIEKASFTVRFVPESEWEHFTICFVKDNPGSRY